MALCYGLCKRLPCSQSFIESDQTLLIVAPRLDDLWVVAIDEMLTEYSQNGIRGRIEKIDQWRYLGRRPTLVMQRGDCSLLGD